MTPKAVPTCGRSKVTSSVAITMNLEFKSTCRRKKHSLFHWNLLMILGLLILIWTSCKKYEMTISGMSMRASICQILGDDSQILLYWKRKLQKDKCGSGETDKVSIDCQTRSCIDSSFGGKLWKSLRIERNRNAKEKPKLDTARRLAGIYFIDPNDKEYEDTLKNPRRKLERPVAPAMPCKGNYSSITKVMAKPKIRSEKKPKTSLMNPRDNKQNLCNLEAMGSALLEKDFLRWHVSNWCTSLSRCHKQWRFQQKLPWTRKGKSSTRSQHGIWFRCKQKIRKSTLSHWWTYVISKIRSWNQNLQKYKGRIVLSVAIVEDDSGAYAIFTEQGLFASQMTAAKNTDVIARWPDCYRQAADAVSPDTQIKLEDAPRLLKILKSECFDVWIRLPRHKWTKSLWKSKDPVIHLERNLYGHPLAGLLWERQFEDALLELGWEKIRIGNACSFIGNKGYFCQYLWMISRWTAKIRIWLPCGQIDEKRGYWRNHIISVPCVLGMYSAWMQTEWNSHWTIYEDVWIRCYCWSSRKITGMAETSRANSSVVLRYGRTCSKMRWAVLWIGKSIQTRWIWICWRIVRSMLTNCLNMLVFGTNWTTWHFFFGQSSNLQEQSQDWLGMWQTTSKANFLGSSHESLSSNWHVGYTAQHCRLGLFQYSDFAGDLEGSKSTSGGVLCIFGSRTFVPVSWMCEKQTSVSHSSTESEIIFLDRGLRMDEFFALDLWTLWLRFYVQLKATINPIELSSGNWRQFNPSILATRKLGQFLILKPRTQLIKESRRFIKYLMWTTCSPTRILPKVKISCTKDEAQQWDMCPEPTELLLIGCSTESILEPKIQITYVDTKNQLADFLTNGSFSRDEWNHFSLFAQHFWVCRHILVAISRNFLSLSLQSALCLVSCRNEDRTQPRTMAHRRHKQDSWIWWCAVSAEKKSRHKVRDLWSIWEWRWQKESWTSPDLATLRFWIAAKHTDVYKYFGRRFWTTTCSRRTIFYNLQQFTPRLIPDTFRW